MAYLPPAWTAAQVRGELVDNPRHADTRHITENYLKEQIAWLATHRNGKPSQRRYERIAPYNRRSTMRTADGGEFVAVVSDIARSGAALKVDATPQVGSKVTIGRTSARVVRHLQDGVAVEFISPVVEAAWSL